MYESFFGFDSRPFCSVPRTDRYFPAESIEAARQSLVRCVQRAEGCGLVIGPPGSGKTLLCHVLAEQFKDQFETVLLSSLRLTTRKELLQAILFEMGLPYTRRQEGELRLSLIDRLAPGDACPHGMLLVVDEADSLSPKLMEELRLLTNLVRGGSLRVRLVLAGGPVLEDRFASPKMESLNQRIAARCYLTCFSSAEVQQYVRSQIAAVGGNPDNCVAADALRAVHHVTDGIPRLINQVCDHALLMAAEAGLRQIDQNRIEEAWADLQQLPLPTSPSPAAVSSVDVTNSSAEPPDAELIEFGSLDDLDATNEAETDEPDEPDEVDLVTDATDVTEPTLQMDDIESQLAEVEESLGSDVHEDNEITLRFNGGLEEADSVDSEDEAKKEVLLSDFSGLEADTVVHLSPTIDDEHHEHDEHVCGAELPRLHDANSLSADVVEPEDFAVLGDFSDLQPVEDAVAHDDSDAVVELPQGETTEREVGENAAANVNDVIVSQSDLESAFDDEGPNIVTAAIDPDVPPLPQLHAAIAGPLRNPQFFSLGDGQPVNVTQPTELAGSVHDDVAVDRAEVSDAAPADAPAEHPTIPVRQRTYRQLFARLRQAQALEIEKSCGEILK